MPTSDPADRENNAGRRVTPRGVDFGDYSNHWRSRNHWPRRNTNPDVK